MKISPTPAHQAAPSMPSRNRCGSRSRYQRSLKVPGSPSSMFTAITRGSGSAATRRHLRPGGKARAAQAAQPRVLHDLGDGLALELSREAIGDQPVAALLAVARIVHIRWL